MGKPCSEILDTLFSGSGDIINRKIYINAEKSLAVTLFCVDGLVNTQVLDETVLRPMSEDLRLKECKNENEIISLMLHGSTYHAFASVYEDMETVLQCVLSGMTAIIFDDAQKAIVFDIRGFDKRGISEPSDEGVIKGAKDSFIEVFRINTAQIRRRIRSPHLVIEQTISGNVSKTDIGIVYIKSIADEALVSRVREKIKNINTDNIATAAFAEEFIADNPSGIFPQAMYTQRPDKFCANITEGRVGVIIDGIPFGYILPCQLPMLMQSPEDYAQNYVMSSILRILRYLSVFITLLLPAYYVSVTTFQYEMIPLELALSIQEAKQEVPFYSFAEVIGMLIALEILIEAGLRLPKTIGQAMSIVGALVVGQAAVEAGFVSPAVVIVTAITGIAGFTIPNQDLSNAFRIVRFLLVIMASLAGIYGMMVGVILMLIHLCSLDNYGIAYLSPFVDKSRSRISDTFLRVPVKYFKFRPEKLAIKNKRKQR